jgi:hypothetical protein
MGNFARTERNYSIENVPLLLGRGCEPTIKILDAPFFPFSVETPSSFFQKAT